MFPNNQQSGPPIYDPNSPQNASEYLDQISAQPVVKKSGIDNLFANKKLIALVGGGIVILFIILVAVASSSGGGSAKTTENMARLNLKYTNLLDVADYGNDALSPSSDLALINAQISLILGSENAQTTNFVDKKYKLDKTIAAAENYSKDTIAELTTANNSGRLNSAYKTTLSTKLTDLISSVDTMRSDKGLAENYRAILDEYYGQLVELQTRVGRSK